MQDALAASAVPTTYIPVSALHAVQPAQCCYTSALLALGARIPVLLYKDRYVAVNKPPGISTHRSFDTGRVLTTQLQRQFRRKVYTVHRLDHRTSGAILFGFDGEAAGECHGRLPDGVKEYVALLRGFDERDAVGSEVVGERAARNRKDAHRRRGVGPAAAAAARSRRFG